MDYKKYSQGFSPSPTYIKNIVLAFFVGGAICELGYLIQAGLIATGMDRELAGIWSTVALICGAQIITGLGWYNTLGRIGGAGAAVPITGFANSIVAPAMEYKKEGVGRSLDLQSGGAGAGRRLFSFRRHRRSLHAHRQNSLGGGYYGRDKGNGGKNPAGGKRGNS